MSVSSDVFHQMLTIDFDEADEGRTQNDVVRLAFSIRFAKKAGSSSAKMRIGILSSPGQTGGQWAPERRRTRVHILMVKRIRPDARSDSANDNEVQEPML